MADSNAAQRSPDESPFDEPSYECRGCGRTDEHIYCDRWAEWLYRLFTRRLRRA